MPEDITTFGLNPVLPAMATLHSIIATQHSMKEMEQAIQLLEFVQSSISEPSKDMQRIYIDLLVEFKMKVKVGRGVVYSGWEGGWLVAGPCSSVSHHRTDAVCKPLFATGGAVNQTWALPTWPD